MDIIDNTEILNCVKTWYLDYPKDKFTKLRSFLNAFEYRISTQMIQFFITNKKLQKHLYKKYFHKYIVKNSQYCETHITNHITMEPLMECFQTGFIDLKKNSEWNKICIKYYNKIRKFPNYVQFHDTHYKAFCEILNELNEKPYHSEVLYSHIEEIMFVYSIHRAMFSLIDTIISNYKNFKDLKPLVEDCELFYIHNLRNVYLKQDRYSERVFNININNNDYVTKHIQLTIVLENPNTSEKEKEEILKKMSELNESQCKYIENDIELLENINRNSRTRGDDIGFLRSELDKTDKTSYESIIQISDTLLTIYKHYADISVKQFNTVYNYNISDSVYDWYSSKMNMVFNNHYITINEIDKMIKEFMYV